MKNSFYLSQMITLDIKINLPKKHLASIIAGYYWRKNIPIPAEIKKEKIIEIVESIIPNGVDESIQHVEWDNLEQYTREYRNHCIAALDFVNENFPE